MDYSNVVPLRRRTRSQEALYIKKLWDERRRADSRGISGSGGGGGGRPDSSCTGVRNRRTDIVCSVASLDSESEAVCDGEEDVDVVFVDESTMDRRRPSSQSEGGKDNEDIVFVGDSTVDGRIPSSVGCETSASNMSLKSKKVSRRSRIGVKMNSLSRQIRKDRKKTMNSRKTNVGSDDDVQILYETSVPSSCLETASRSKLNHDKDGNHETMDDDDGDNDFDVVLLEQNDEVSANDVSPGPEDSKGLVEVEESEEMESSRDEDSDDAHDVDFILDNSSSSSSDFEGSQYEEEVEEEKNQEADYDDCSGDGKFDAEKFRIDDALSSHGSDFVIEGLNGKDEDEEQKHDDVDDDEDGDEHIGSSSVSINEAGKRKREKIIEGGLKRLTFSGLDILVACDKDNYGGEHRTLLRRLRPRSVTKFRGKKQKFGKYTCPLHVDEIEVSDFLCGGDNSRENDNVDGSEVCAQTVVGKKKNKLEKGNKRSSNDNDGDEHIPLLKRLRPLSVLESGGKKLEFGKNCLEFSDSSCGDDSSGENANVDCSQEGATRVIGKKGRKKLDKNKKSGKKGLDFVKILADSIFEGNEVEKKLESSTVKIQAQESLPLKFSFEDDETSPPEEPEWQKEVDGLFAELDMALRASEVKLFNSSEVDDEDDISTETDRDPATTCGQGGHHYFLDDEIGIRCRFCHVVQIEIKHVLPPFSKRPLERWNKYLGTDVRSILEDLQFSASICQRQCGFKGSFYDQGTVWDAIPGIKESMFPHQREGFEFIWKNIAGDMRIDKLKKILPDGGTGCIISHAPGTGKTRLTIVFLLAFARIYSTCRSVIVAPRSMLLTWEDEFRKWNVDIPFHNLNNQELSGKENAVAINLLKKVGKTRQTAYNTRLVKLYSWTKDTSILGISYRLFERLAGRNQCENFHPEDEQVRKILLELPNVLVLDEGHIPRNEQSLIWKALLNTVTQRRIILSGTPFQNNFTELYNTLCLVNPKFDEKLSLKKCTVGMKRSRLQNKIFRRKWASLTSTIGKSAEDKLRKLRELINPFVHLHKGTILQEHLPGLRDSLVVLRPTDLQNKLLKCTPERSSWLEEARFVSLISVHPFLLSKCLTPIKDFPIKMSELRKLKLHSDAGIKTIFVIELVHLSQALDEKVLIFSQYVDPLTYIMERLKSHFGWTEGREVLYMDGKLDMKQRQASICSLNDPKSEAKVLLATTKACSEGINLVGASRVVLLDVVWNPSVERQAISRAYRLGQKKVVHIYHLITSGTMEVGKYLRQAEKDRLSELVFSSGYGKSYKPEISSKVSEDSILDVMVQQKMFSHMIEKILYQPKESDLIETFGLMDSL